MHSIHSLVVPIDFSDPSRAAVSHAVALARIDGASIHFVHALTFPLLASPYDVSVPAAVWEGIRRGASEKIEALRKEAETSGAGPVTTEIAETSDPVGAIAQAVATHDADLVVMGTHGWSGIKRACFGSVTERTIRALACPVLAAREPLPSKDAQIRRIMVPVDFSEHSDEAAATASSLANRLGASVDLVHAIDFTAEYAAHLAADAIAIEDKMQAVASERLDEVARTIEGSGVKVETHMLRGAPSAVIAEKAKRLGTDLIVMGTHGHTGLTHLFIGSVTERTLRTAPCSVLAVKAEKAEA